MDARRPESYGEFEVSGVGKAAREGIAGLFPGYFAMVMATGVVAVQANKLGFAIPARGLVATAIVAYLVIWMLTILRSYQFAPQLVADFRSFVKGPAFFTTSAGTTVLGQSLLLVLALPAAAEGLWVFAWFIWAFLMYSFGLNLFTSRPKQPIERSVNGVWLIIPVATQSLSILTSLLSPYIANHGLMMLVSLSLFMLGDALYLVVICAVVYRLAFFDLEPDDLKPAYWVCMGASAISTLAGVELCKRVDIWQLPFQPLPSLQGFTMFFWVVASAWIPLLLLLGFWRHGVRRVPLAYDPQYWSMVFPLGMYAFATHSAATEFKLTFIEPIASVFLPIACLAWLWVFGGMTLSIVRHLFTARGVAAVSGGETA